MERFSHRESVLLGYNPHAHRSSSTNPSTPLRNSDVDFHDVFGGPPRRSSVQEMRFSLAESADYGGGSEEEGSGSGREKPVFGEDNSNYRRRHTNYNFYDDIFGGDEISPTRHERNPFSRIMSPVLPYPSGHDDSFAPSSLPSTLSLPAKMTKGMDIPTFGSPGRTLRNNNIITSNEQIISSSSNSASTTPLSRFSKLTTQPKEDSTKNGSNSRSHRQSLLAQEFSDKGSDGGGHFHFSIHKWATKGVVPLVMPLRSSRLKENVKLERSSSAKDWTSLGYNNASSSMNNGKQVGATNFTSSQQQQVSGKPNLETLSNGHHVINDVSGSALSSDTRAESSNYSSSEVGSSGRMKGKKPESKSLHSLFSKRDDKQVYDEKTKWEKGKESKTKKGEQNNTAVLKGAVEVSKATSQGSLSLDEKIENGRVKGKVKEFVRIFSQEDLTKPRVDTKSRTQASENKLRNASRTKDEVSVGTFKKVEDNPEISKKEDSATEAINVSTENLSRQDNISAAAIPNSTDVIGDKGGFFHENFQVKELVQEENEVLQTQDNQEIKVIDNKIRQWSNGKEGNIRSLLSTLQYVLWPESGWKPVPLVDIIEGNAVKRSYQRALLCLHPDKLQQKGAAFHQKYIAEKVFDILQEAWTHFNMLGAI